LLIIKQADKTRTVYSTELLQSRLFKEKSRLSLCKYTHKKRDIQYPPEGGSEEGNSL